MSADEANALLMGSGVQSASFKILGAEYKGSILALDVMHARKFGTTDLDFWDDGKPKMQVVVTIQTDARVDDDDDGKRNIYLDSKGKKVAVQEAVRKSGASGLAVGGKIKLKYLRDDEEKGGVNPPKIYGARYEPPAVSVDDDYDEPAAPAATNDLSQYSEEPF